MFQSPVSPGKYINKSPQTQEKTRGESSEKERHSIYVRSERLWCGLRCYFVIGYDTYIVTIRNQPLQRLLQCDRSQEVVVGGNQGLNTCINLWNTYKTFRKPIKTYRKPVKLQVVRVPWPMSSSTSLCNATVIIGWSFKSGTQKLSNINGLTYLCDLLWNWVKCRKHMNWAKYRKHMNWAKCRKHMLFQMLEIYGLAQTHI